MNIWNEGRKRVKGGDGGIYREREWMFRAKGEMEEGREGGTA